MKTEINQGILSLIETCKNDLDCLKILADFKWSADNSRYICRKCKHTKCSIRKINLARDCNKCHHIESPTAGTLFHKLKFGIRKAFIIVFEMGNTPRAISASQMARKTQVMRSTASIFMSKVRKAMEDHNLPSVRGNIQVLTFAFGYKENFRPKQSRHPKRKKIIVAVELTGKGCIKHTIFKVIKNYSSQELRTLFDRYIENKSHVTVEKWPGFEPLKKDFIITSKSKKFQNFIQTNRIVHDLKIMLRSTYTSVKQEYLQSYLDEFSFKINHSNVKEQIFNILINRMLKHEPMFLNYKNEKMNL